MNKNEYYRFSTNLNAQIAVDKEKAKNGDVDAMVRLARYYRTGKTLGKPFFALYYEDELVEDTLGCYYYDADNHVREVCDKTELWSEEELEENKKLAEKYAKKAKETGTDGGCYEYACFLNDQLWEPFIEDSMGESLFGVLKAKIEGGVYLEDATLDEMIYIQIDEDDCAKYDSNEIVCIEGKKYVRPTKEEMDGLWICRPHPEKIGEYQQIIEKLQQIEKEWFNILCDLAEKGVVCALLDLGRHYHNLGFDALFKSKGTEDGDIYIICRSLHPENCDYQQSFAKAVAYLEQVLLCDNSTIIEEASLMMANIHAQEEYLYSDIKKAIQYYDRSGRIYGADADLLADFYIRNIEKIALDKALKWLSPRKRMYSWDNKALNKIIEATPKEGLKENFDKIISLNQDSLLQNERTLDILMEKMIFSEEQLVDYCIAKIRALNKDLFIGEPVDELEKVAEENGLKIEEKALDECLLMDLYKCKNYMLCTAIYNAKKYDAYYQLVKKMSDDGNSYAQYKLGAFLYGLTIRETEEGEENFFVIGKDISGLLDKTTCESMAKELLISSYHNGNVEALLELGLHCDEYLTIAYETFKSSNKFDALINLRMSGSCLRNEQYGEAKKYLEEGFCHTSSKTLFAEELLTYYEQIDNKSAQNFVWNFFDMIKEKGFCDECFSFVNDKLVPLLLDNDSIYYNPQYAIRILQSSEFSTSEGYYKLGCIYSDGEHVEKNYEQALKFFELAANEDVGEAWYRLAYLYYYGDGGNVDLQMAKRCFEKAIFCGFNCEYAYEMVRTDLNEEDESNPMKEYAESLIQEVARGAERNTRIMQDMAYEFGEYWEKLNEKIRRFIYSGIKIYVDNCEEDDPYFDYSSSISEMSKSLETLLGEVFYTNYKRWLRKHDVKDIKSYFESLGARVYTENDPFELGIFKRITYSKQTVNDDYETVRKNIRKDKIPAIVVKNGNEVYKMQLFDKFAKYVDSIFKEDVFSTKERMQEITAFVINLVDQVEVIRSDLRNRASHDALMKAKHVEKCGNILYKTKKVLYGIVSKIK